MYNGRKKLHKLSVCACMAEKCCQIIGLQDQPLNTTWMGNINRDNLVKEIQSVLNEVLKDETFNKMMWSRLKVFVYISSKLERTLPKQYAYGDIMRLLDWSEAGEKEDMPCKIKQYFKSECDNTNDLSPDTESIRFRLLQQYRASSFFLKTNVMDIEALSMAHKTMFDGCIDISNPGKFRNHDVFATLKNGDKNPYLSHTFVEEFMNDLINNHSQSEWKSCTIPELCDIVAKFVAKFLQIHPFPNGNGRMARLIISWFFYQRFGVILLMNTHHRARQHWILALRIAQNQLCTSRFNLLSNLILESFASTLAQSNLLLCS